MSEFTCLLGEPALSKFRNQKLVRRIEKQLGSAVGSARLYLVGGESTAGVITPTVETTVG